MNWSNLPFHVMDKIITFAVKKEYHEAKHKNDILQWC